MHDATKVLLGSIGSSKRLVTCEADDPATFLAGLAVRRAADGGLQLADDSTAALIGVSLGRDLSNTAKTAVCRKGLGVPLRQKVYAATGTITIEAYADLIDAGFDTIEVAGVVFVAQAGAATLGTATFRAATSDGATAISLAAQINAHATTSELVEATVDGDDVIVTAIEAGEDGNELTLVYTDEGTATVGASVTGSGTLEDGSDGAAVHGKIVYVNDDGLGCLSTDADAVATLATYNGGVISGVDPITAAEVNAAIIDMVGGL